MASRTAKKQRAPIYVRSGGTTLRLGHNPTKAGGGRAYLEPPTGEVRPSGRRVYTRVYVGEWDGAGQDTIPRETWDASVRVVERVDAHGGTLPRDSETRRDVTQKLGRSLMVVREEFRISRAGHYRRQPGKNSTELDNILHAIDLVAPHVPDDLSDLRINHLEAARRAIASGGKNPAGRSRQFVNDTIRRFMTVVRWADERDELPPSVLRALRIFKPLPFGCQGVRETARVRPVPFDHVERTLAELQPRARAIASVCLHSGCRVGEACAMRPSEIIRAHERVWIYRPEQHKTSKHGYDRLIPLGPSLVELVEPYVDGRDPDAYCFSPREAEAERLQRVSRKSRAGDRYSTGVVRNAIYRACDRANVPKWSPGRLRHNAATRIKSHRDLDAAKDILGHHSMFVTQMYAEQTMEKIVAMALKLESGPPQVFADSA